MQESHPSVTRSTDTRAAPLHDDIAQCARDLWVQCGQPVDRDQAIWLEAEQRLLAATQAQPGESSGPASSSGRPPAKRMRASARRTAPSRAPAVRAES